MGIVAQANTFTLAGYETTANTLGGPASCCPGLHDAYGMHYNLLAMLHAPTGCRQPPGPAEPDAF